MSRFWIALSIWFLCLMAAVMFAVWLHNKDQQHVDWEPGFVGTVKEKMSGLYKKLKSKIKGKKS